MNYTQNDIVRGHVCGYNNIFEFSIDIQQSIVNATNYTVAKSFIIILEHKKILDIYHNCLQTVFQSISYTIELF